MSPALKILSVVVSLVVIAVVVLMLAGPSMQRSLFYPKPRQLPPVVSQSTSELLARLQSVLESNAPAVARSLQPGLTDAQIGELEAQGGFQLTGDLKALYRWHNGMTSNSTVGLLPGQKFVPLDEVVLIRRLNGEQLASVPTVQRAAFSAFAGHTKGWVHIVDDGAGDGFFYDPKRTEAEGAFFGHFAETGDYSWFPSLRNFLAGVIECYESRVVRVAADGENLDADFVRLQQVWERLAESRNR